MSTLFGWLEDHAALISALAAVASFLVWLAYFQLFFYQYLRQHRPRLLLHVAPGEGLDGSCLLVNMSQQIVHVVCILAVAQRGEAETVRQVTGYRRIAAQQESSAQIETAIKQGPLSPGNFIVLGTFRELLEDATPEPADALELRVVAHLGSQDAPVGARRRFRVVREGQEPRLEVAAATEQLSRRRERREVRGWLERCLREG